MAFDVRVFPFKLQRKIVVVVESCDVLLQRSFDSGAS